MIHVVPIAVKDAMEALLMHARPTYCYANKAFEMGPVLALSIIGFLVVETRVVLKEDEAARPRLEHRISLLREADRSVIHSPTRAIPTHTNEAARCRKYVLSVTVHLLS